MWVINDNARETSTGYPEHDRAGAEATLRAYVERGGIEWNGATFVDLTKRPPGFLYFITSAELADYPIKIGYTDNADVSARLRTLQNGNPHKLEILASLPGSLSDERRMFERFAALRMAGEWFRRSPELVSFIETGARPR
jgi:hypothetical protein